MLQDLTLNLFSEVIGIVITVFFIDKLLKKREEHKWAPARAVVAKQFARTFAAATYATRQVVAPLVETQTAQRRPPANQSAEALAAYQHNLQRLHCFVELTNAAMDGDMMSHLSHFIETSEELLRRLAFVFAVHDANCTNVKLVCDSPVALLEKMEESVDYFRTLYPSFWTDRTLSEISITPLQKLRELYAEVPTRCARLSFDISSVKHEEGISVRVPDLDHLRRIPTKEALVGTEIQVGVPPIRQGNHAG